MPRGNQYKTGAVVRGAASPRVNARLTYAERKLLAEVEGSTGLTTGPLTRLALAMLSTMAARDVRRLSDLYESAPDDFWRHINGK